MDLNKATLIGNVARNPEVKELPSGQNVVKISIATNHAWKDKQTGEKKTKADFHTVIAWNNLAKIIQEYVKKGDKIYIEGRINNSTWEGSDGKKRYYTDIVASHMIMLGGKGKKEVTNEATEDTVIVEEENSGESPF